MAEITVRDFPQIRSYHARNYYALTDLQKQPPSALTSSPISAPISPPNSTSPRFLFKLTTASATTTTVTTTIATPSTLSDAQSQPAPPFKHSHSLPAPTPLTSVVAPTVENFTQFVTLNLDGTSTVFDLGAAAFNESFRACPVVRGTRSSGTAPIYVRKTPVPPTIDPYTLFTGTFGTTDNVFNTDFELYSDEATMWARVNKWNYCPGSELVGYIPVYGAGADGLCRDVPK